MSRYFKAIEISEDEFYTATGERLDCLQDVIPTDGAVYVGVDNERKDEITIDLDCFGTE